MPQKILREVSGLHSALRSLVFGRSLLGIQVNVVLRTDTDITMNFRRNILARYYKFNEGKGAPIYREPEDSILVILEYVLAPMQAILPGNSSHMVYFETFQNICQI